MKGNFELNLPMQKNVGGYWKDLVSSISSVLAGLKLTGKHMLGIFKSSGSKNRLDIRKEDYFQQQFGLPTVQYPHEEIPVPENGRYKLHNEIDDCIVCDKCVKVCPVNCITIEAIRSPEEFGKTSDGTAKRIYAAKFDIDMSKCCFCGLCTTVCPTECLTMTPNYAFSTFNLGDHYFEFAEMNGQEIEKRKKEWEVHLAAKEESKTNPGTPSTSQAPKPVFKPIMKPIVPKPTKPAGDE